MSIGALIAVDAWNVPVWALVAIGVTLAAVLVGGGLVLWWPGHTRENWREIGLALVTGAVVAFGLFVLEALVQVNARHEEQTRQERFQRDSLRVALGQQPDLSRIGLVGLDLSGFYLRGKTLVEADLRRADLREANLDGADLTGADLRDAKLEESSLVNATLLNATLDGAHLDAPHGGLPVDLELATLTLASLVSTRLDGAHLDLATLRRANLANAYLSGANLVGAHLNFANLRGAHLDGGADLSYADLTGADLRGADLSGAHVGPRDPSTGKERLDPDKKSVVTAIFSDVLADRNTKWPDACPGGSWCRRKRPTARAPRLGEFKSQLAGRKDRKLPFAWRDKSGTTFLNFTTSREGDASFLVEGLRGYPPLPIQSPRAVAAGRYNTDCNLSNFQEKDSGAVQLGRQKAWMRDFKFLDPETAQYYVRQIDLYYRVGTDLYVFTAEVRDDLFRLYLADFRKLFGSLDVHKGKNHRVLRLDGALVGPPGRTNNTAEKFSCK